MTADRLTDACTRALDVVAEWGGSASESNETSMSRGLVYWQSVKQLIERGLIEGTRRDGRLWLDLTDAGRKLHASP